MAVVDEWTGATASALRVVLRLTIDQFARELGTASRTVAKWNTDAELVPTPELQHALDTMLQRASVEVQERFAQELRLNHDPTIAQALSWLDAHARWPEGEARARVAAILSRPSPPPTVRRRSTRDIGRADIAARLGAYYRPEAGFGCYSARFGSELLSTSILTRASWSGYAVPLGRGADQMALTTGHHAPAPELDDVTAAAAVERVAAAVRSNIRLVDSAIYDLDAVGFAEQVLTADFNITDFLSYALTLDLLEGELLQAIANEASTEPGSLPLRDRLLPDLATVVDLRHRVCAGGAQALFAAARRGSRGRPGTGDYVFLIQQRSADTINSEQRIAVIPKAFHEPLVDFTDDAQILVTIERQLEEELLGREDLDGADARRSAYPLDPSRLSAPMRWLKEHPDPATWRVECTGFGLNLVSGTFEFASLIVVEDESWWEQFAGNVQVNREADGLGAFSTLDHASVTRLVHDAAWRNEGLFALLQGLRRLAETGGSRVALPSIIVEL